LSLLKGLKITAMYLVLPCVAAVITSTVLYAVDYNKVY